MNKLRRKHLLIGAGDLKADKGGDARELSSRKKRRLRLYAYVGAGLLLLILAALSIGYLKYIQSSRAAKTPIVMNPVSSEDPAKIKVPTKKEQYLQEIRNRKRNEKKEALEADRLERISMSWEKIYGAKEKEGEAIAVLQEREDVWEKRELENRRALGSRRKKSGENRASPHYAVKEKEFYSKGDYVPKTKSNPKSHNDVRVQQKNEILAKRFSSEQNGEIIFNTLSRGKLKQDEIPIARVRGYIAGDQKIRAGQYIKLRLAEDLLLASGEVLPAASQLMGLCAFGNSRVKAEVQAVYLKGELLPIRLKVFDQDLIEGIAYHDPRIKEREQREVENSANSIYDDLFSEIPYAGAFLNAGRNIARSRLREKSRKVSLPNNYPLIFQVYPN
ncbi:MAG: conjugative transposon protein TraM [Bacteroidia bacterium]|nr:conjugative transposon protein TraM [Bacteroidia bacterium]